MIESKTHTDGNNTGLYYVPIEILDAIEDYRKWLNGLRLRAWKIYYFAALFEHLGVSEDRIVPVMQNEIATVQGRFLTRYCRNPHSNTPKPMWVVVPDKPVYKKKKVLRAISSFDPNYGIHMNGMIAVPPGYLCRSNLGLKKLMNIKGENFFTRGTRICDFHLKRIRDDAKDLVDYSFKHVKRGTFSLSEDILILPRSLSEF